MIAGGHSVRRATARRAVGLLTVLASVGVFSLRAEAPSTPSLERSSGSLAPAAGPTAGPGQALEARLRLAAPDLEPTVLQLALRAVLNARARGVEVRSNLLTVIDYTRPSTEPRLWVLDLDDARTLFTDLVAHGASTGELLSEYFSNRPGSRQTSLGLFLTGDTYTGRNGYSLRLIGLEPGVNDRALERAIVIHGADYVSEEFARARGRLGRSWGCPAVSTKLARPIIDAIKGGSLVFSYHADPQWLASSEFLRD